MPFGNKALQVLVRKYKIIDCNDVGAFYRIVNSKSSGRFGV